MGAVNKVKVIKSMAPPVRGYQRNYDKPALEAKYGESKGSYNAIVTRQKI